MNIIILSRWKIGDSDSHGGNQTRSYGETLSISELNHFLAKFLENLDYQDFDAKIIINGFTIKSSSAGEGLSFEKGLSFETLLKGKKPVILEKKKEIHVRQMSVKENLTSGSVHILMLKTR